MTSVPMVYQQKIAEKLAVLTDRAKGMLTRIYNIKKMLSLNSKPGFLSEKQYEKAVQLLGGKKFPVDAHSGSGTLQILQILNPHKNSIMNALNLYYYTFVDIFDLKNAINDTLTTVDVCQLSFSIVLNYDLTKSYLELIALHCAITIILSKIDDRKVVLGMFNYVFYLDKNKDEEYYKKVANYFMEIENPLKKLTEDFMPHKNSLRTAINSLSDVYPRRANVAAQWRTQQYLSLLYDSNKLLSCYHTDTCPCEYLSVESMERWIIMSVTICNSLLEDPKINHLWQTALSNSFVMALCRDEVVPTHQFSIAHFESMKGLGALVGIVKNSRDHAYKQALQNHRDKRKYLRTALKELSLVLTDQPGLLGPKALILFSALSNARDEIRWLMRHSDNIPTKSKNKILEEDLKDRQIPELIFLVEELRSLAKKYSQVIQRYYVQFLSGGDVNALESLMVNIEGEEESEILSSFVMTFKGLSVKQVEDQSINIGELRAVRMDWCRMQAYMASPQARLKLSQHQTLARHLNTIAFHTRLVDTLDDLLNETSDLSLYCFYMHKLEMQFKECMEFPAQHRYSIAFPQVCAHFLNATHRLCPEERQSIGSTSVQYTHWFLKEMSEEVNQVITAICEEQCHLTDQLLPKHCAIQIVNLNAKKSKKDKDRILQEEKKPGHESVRKQREEFTRMDKLHMALTELCYAFNYTNIITVWNHGFVPREFFLNHLEDRFNKLLVGMMMYNPQTSEIAKPSELLAGVYAVMNVLQSIENYIHIDMSRIFNSVLPQQTQQRDTFHGNPTIAFNYSQWYLEVLMLKVSEDKVIYSPNHKAFLTLDSETHFQAEEYADLVELRALAELIGPYGMKLMGEKIVWHISKQVEELKALVIQNKIYLNALRTNYDDSELVKGTVKKLQNSDNLLKRVSIIGELLSFRSLAQEALQDVLDQRIPFLLSSIRDFHKHMPHTGDTMIVNEMASAAGIQCDIDPALCTMLRNQRQNQAPENPAASVQDDDFSVACLLLVFIAVSLPKWARLESSRFNPAFEGHMNNAHCIAKAVNALASSLLTVQGKQNEIGDRLKEFLALASASLLRLGQETDRDVIRNRESIYLLLDQIVQESPFLTMDLLESCFPYALLRNAYHQVAKAHGH